MTVAAGLAQTGNPISLASDGWTVTADGEQGVFSIAQDTLGTVIKDARFNLKGEHGLRPLKNWSVYKEVQPRLLEQARHQLSIRTVQPQTGWLIELAPNSLKISSTEADGVLTAEAPASTDRVVARVLDPQGCRSPGWEPMRSVNWGASETRNPSFLPSQNPECMYFALGQVSGTNLHSLFDRKTDTAINSRTRPDAAQPSGRGTARCHHSRAGEHAHSPGSGLLHENSGASFLCADLTTRTSASRRGLVQLDELLRGGDGAGHCPQRGLDRRRT